MALWVTVDTEDISLRLCLVTGRQRPEQNNADAKALSAMSEHADLSIGKKNTCTRDC